MPSLRLLLPLPDAKMPLIEFMIMLFFASPLPRRDTLSSAFSPASYGCRFDISLYAAS